MNQRLLLSAITVSLLSGAAAAQNADMSLIVTSVGSGKGADLGGLDGVDAHCQSLAQSAGVSNKTWRARGVAEA